MKKIFKIRLNTVTDKMSGRDMRMIVGGYGGGSGTYDDPYQLPEVIICPPDQTKISVCVSKQEWAQCSWIYDCKLYHGNCVWGFGPASFHCSS